MRVFPWVRLAHVELGDTFDTVKSRLELLVNTARAWNESTIIPNYEKEAETFAPSDVAEYLYGDLGWGYEDHTTCWSMQAWLPNAVDYTDLTTDPVHLQIFPADNNWPVDKIKELMADCVWHARVRKGFQYVGVTYQTYASALPEWYDCGAFCHSVFPGNEIGHGQWDRWFPV